MDPGDNDLARLRLAQGQVEIITWIDAIGESELMADAQDVLRTLDLTVTSIGAVVAETEEVVLLAMEIHSDEQIRGWTAIPKVCIRERLGIYGLHRSGPPAATPPLAPDPEPIMYFETAQDGIHDKTHRMSHNTNQ